MKQREKFEDWATTPGTAKGLDLSGYSEMLDSYEEVETSLAWLAWQESAKQQDEEITKLRRLLAEEVFSNLRLHEEIAVRKRDREITDGLLVEEIAQLTVASARLEGIRKLMGYVHNRTSDSVTFCQDDATYSYMVRVGKRVIHADSFEQAVDAAVDEFREVP